MTSNDGIVVVNHDSSRDTEQGSSLFKTGVTCKLLFCAYELLKDNGCKLGRKGLCFLL